MSGSKLRSRAKHKNIYTQTLLRSSLTLFFRCRFRGCYVMPIQIHIPGEQRNVEYYYCLASCCVALLASTLYSLEFRQIDFVFRFFNVQNEHFKLENFDRKEKSPDAAGREFFRKLTPQNELTMSTVDFLFTLIFSFSWLSRLRTRWDTLLLVNRSWNEESVR